ncbi:MAG: class I SAM-dependent methyltransferase [Deltaproteobacteria bacterium]|jgi:ubiquinone/menaquinone biosynthesis C-methylase UbiE|nr:class I SAM-dependent methyltransferase [Deltaproteobacteria bacterium]
MSSHHVCPWWFAYTFDNPLRKLFHKPATMLGDYVHEGMIVMDVGCGMGYFTLGMAELVGNEGKVVAVDLQQEMLDIMQKRATKKGLLHRIVPVLAEPDSINHNAPVDFILAFWMVHETPDPESFFRQAAALLKFSAKLFYAEPAFHVSLERYREILTAAEKSGLAVSKEPAVRFSHAALLEKVV